MKYEIRLGDLFWKKYCVWNTEKDECIHCFEEAPKAQNFINKRVQFEKKQKNQIIERMKKVKEICDDPNYPEITIPDEFYDKAIDCHIKKYCKFPYPKTTKTIFIESVDCYLEKLWIEL